MKTCILQVSIDDNRPLINFCTSKVKEWSESNGYDYVCVDTLSSWAARFPRLPYNFQKFQSFYERDRCFYERPVYNILTGPVYMNSTGLNIDPIIF